MTNHMHCASARLRALRLAAAMLALSCLCAGPARAWPVPQGGRAWTLQDIAAAPEVTDLLISEDGRQATYIVRAGDLGRDEKISRLHQVDLATGADRELAASTWIGTLRAIPGSDALSVLADAGQGVQLYRIDHAGRFVPLRINPDLDQVGGPMEGLHPVGISDYGWSPDGAAYWYERRTADAQDPRVLNPRMLPAFTLYGRNPIELHVVEGDGHEVVLDHADAASAGFFAVEWGDDGRSLTYWARNGQDQAMEQRRWSHGQSHPVLVTRESDFYSPAVGIPGPQGGVLSTRGVGSARTLIETRKDGGVIDYGKVGFRLGHPMASGAWRSPQGDVALFGIREYGTARFGLARLSQAGGVQAVVAEGSLTHCAVNRAFTAGACVQQSMTLPPRLVRLDPRSGAIAPVLDLAPGYAAIAPLRVQPRAWTNRDGYVSTGMLVYPRGYVAGRAYPAIVVTHGGDADQRFAAADFQWEYPVQAWAERGYLVMAINEPAGSDNAELGQAYAQWGGSGSLPLERVQDLIWINTVHSFEDAVGQLAAEGLVDPGRVGIAGYSFGSQTVNVAMTQSRAFRAASSGDGGYLEPSGYFLNTASYQAIYGGSPYDPVAVPRYQRLSPTFRVGQAAGPVLQQVARGSSGQLEFHVALRAAGVPSELVHYPAESHIFYRPSNRLRAMQENLDWFDFWLLGTQDPDPAKAAQYARWRAMRTQWRQGR